MLWMSRYIERLEADAARVIDVNINLLSDLDAWATRYEMRRSSTTGSC